MVPIGQVVSCDGANVTVCRRTADFLYIPETAIMLYLLAGELRWGNFVSYRGVTDGWWLVAHSSL